MEWGNWMFTSWALNFFFREFIFRQYLRISAERRFHFSSHFRTTEACPRFQAWPVLKQNFMKPENPQKKSPASLSHPEGQTDNENRYHRRFRTKKRSQIFFHLYVDIFTRTGGWNYTFIFTEITFILVAVIWRTKKKI